MNTVVAAVFISNLPESIEDVHQLEPIPAQPHGRVGASRD
jgi:hypothetical protein